MLGKLSGRDSAACAVLADLPVCCIADLGQFFVFVFVFVFCVLSFVFSSYVP